MPQLNLVDFSPQIIWLVITFAALYFVMWKVALPRIGDVLEERQERISDDRDKAEGLRGEADEAIQAYETALTNARAEAHETAQKTREELNAVAESKRAEVEARLATESGVADERIAAARAEALGHIRTVASDTAKSITSRLIGLDASEAALQSAVDAALAGDK